MADKSLCVTYLLWLTLGWFGVHHFYLRRDRHAFVWFWTAGGCFGMGWITEFFRLSEYVDEANGNVPLPPSTTKRFTGELIFSLFLGGLSTTAIPDELTETWPILKAIAPIFVALGVHTVANIGNEECSYWTCLIGAYLPLPMFIFGTPSNIGTAIMYSCLVSSFGANWSGQIFSINWTGRTYRRSLHPTRNHFGVGHRHVCVRLAIIAAASLVVAMMLMSTVYFNSYVTTRDGEQIRLRDAINNILESPAWAEFRQTFHRLLQHLYNDGFRSFVREFSVVLDPEGEESAYQMLDLPSNAGEQEITKRYRELVKQFHPDKVKTENDEEQKQVEEHFIKIQKAFERLSHIKKRRMSRSREL